MPDTLNRKQALRTPLKYLEGLLREGFYDFFSGLPAQSGDFPGSDISDHAFVVSRQQGEVRVHAELLSEAWMPGKLTGYFKCISLVDIKKFAHQGPAPSSRQSADPEYTESGGLGLKNSFLNPDLELFH